MSCFTLTTQKGLFEGLNLWQGFRVKNNSKKILH